MGVSNSGIVLIGAGIEKIDIKKHPLWEEFKLQYRETDGSDGIESDFEEELGYKSYHGFTFGTPRGYTEVDLIGFYYESNCKSLDKMPNDFLDKLSKAKIDFQEWFGVMPDVYIGNMQS